MEIPGLEELYLRHRTDVYRYLCSLTHNAAEAEDMLSETFLRALKSLPRFKGECSVKTWLFGIARNIWLESLRKQRPAASVEELTEALLARYLADTLAQDTETRRTLARVGELLAQREPRAGQVVRLRAAGYTYTEIAARLHITESSARVIEHRTRLWLKTTLQKEGYLE